MSYLVVALAIAVRIAWVLAVPTKPVGDFAMYVESAAHLVAHGNLDPAYVYMPGYVFLIAPVQALGGGWLATKLVGAVLGGLGAAAVAGITRQVSGSARAGLCAGLLVALWPAGIAIASVTGTDMPAAVLVVLAAWALVRFAGARPLLAAVLFGLLTGLAAYIRAIVVPLAVLSVLVFRAAGQPWRRATGLAALAATVALLVLAPWAVRNRLRYGETFFTDSHGGLTALVGANPNTDGCYSRSLNRSFRDVTGYTLLAEPHREADRASLAIAKDWLRFDPRFSLALLASKAERLLVHERALLYWPLFRAGVLPEPQRAFFARQRGTIEAVADGFWLGVLALALMGMALAAQRRQWLALALLPQALVLAALYTAIFAEPRYRLPISMLLVPFAVMAMAWIRQTVTGILNHGAARSWRREAVLALGFAGTVFVAAPVLAAGAAHLRERHRWAVSECTVDGSTRFCKWESLRFHGNQGEVPASLRGVWDGIGLPLVPPALSTATELDLEPGDVALALSVDIAPRDAAAPEVEGALAVTVDGQAVGQPIPLHEVARLSRAGAVLAWSARARHVGGRLRVGLRLEVTAGQALHPSGRLWLSGLRLARSPAATGWSRPPSDEPKSQ